MTTYEKIYKIQNNACFYCNEKTDFNLMEKEHVFPHSKGGRGIKNKVLSCHFCNNLKSNLTIENFKLKIEKLLINKNVKEDKKIKLKIILNKLNKLENGEEIRKGWHKNAIYESNNINEIPKIKIKC